MSRKRHKKRKSNAKPGIPGCGLGPHQEASPMARGTVTKSLRGRQIQTQRKEKQRGYVDPA